MTLDEQIESDLLDMWLLWERGNWYLNDDHPNYEKEHDRRFRDAIVEYITKLVAERERLAKIEMLKTFLAYEEKQPGFVDWDFLDGQLTSLELTKQEEQ